MSNKIYSNDPCPCGSGKKYKCCCGNYKFEEINKTDEYMIDYRYANWVVDKWLNEHENE